MCNSNMLVKVCGMRDARNIREVESLGIGMMGFIFYPKSKRYCANVPEYLPVGCKRVGVFVNADDDFIAERVESFGLDVLQLHGDESAGRVREVKHRFGLPVIKAVKIPRYGTDGGAVLSQWQDSNSDWLLFETECDTYGGSGCHFDWSSLDCYRGDTPFILTGGIAPDDAEEILALQHPKFAGIDLNSRFEAEPGIKDAEKLRTFLNTIRQ